MPKPRSSVWDIFHKHPDGGSVICNLCGNTFAHPTNSTGNLKRHLTSKHGGQPAAFSTGDMIPKPGNQPSNTWLESLTETATAVLTVACKDDADAVDFDEETIADFNSPMSSTRMPELVNDTQAEVEIETTCYESQPQSNTTSNVSRSAMKSKRQTWRYFSLNRSERSATCVFCQKKYSYANSNSTSNLHRHLQIKHKDRLSADVTGGAPIIDRTKLDEPNDSHNTTIGFSLPPARKIMQPRSIVWKYFIRLAAPHTAQCRLCSKIMLIPRGTSCALNHLRTHHSQVMRQNGEAIASLNNVPDVSGSEQLADELEAEGNSSTPIKTEGGRASAIGHQWCPPRTLKNATAKMLDMRLLRLLQHDLVAAQPPSGQYTAPFPTANSLEHLSVKHAEVAKRVMHTLDGCDHIALTVATSSVTAGHFDPASLSPYSIYIAVSAHCITRSDWQLHSQLLSCVQLSSLDATSVQLYLRDLCSEWRITAKVFAFVAVPGPDEPHDCFGGLDVAMGWLRLQCVEARLSDCIAEAMFFNEFEFVRLKVKLIEEVFTGDGGAGALAKFRHFQREHLGQTVEPLLPQLQLLGDDNEPQEWRSTLLKLQRLCGLQVPLDATLELLRHENRLSIGDWMCIRDMRVQLGLLAEAIVDLRARRAVSASKVCVILHGLDAQLEAQQLSEFRGETSKQFAAQLQRTLTNHFATDVECDLMLTVCSLLDPRFRRYGFVQQHSLEICRVHVESLAGQVAAVAGDVTADANAEPDTEAEAEAETEAMGVWSWLDGQVAAERRNESAATMAQHEVQLYLNNLHIDRAADPLAWWRTSGSLTFPRLALVARKYLALPASCAVSRSALEHLERWLGTKEACASWQIDGPSAEKLTFLLENLHCFD